MPIKNTLLKYQNFINADMSGDLVSAVTNIQFLDDIGVQLNFTGDAVGDFFVEISIDYAQDSQGVVTNPGHWVAITLSPAPVASGADDQIFIDIQQISAPWIRVSYASSSGSGVLNGFLCAKAV